MRRRAALALTLVLLGGCGTGSQPASRPAAPATATPERNPALDTLPLVAEVHAAASPHTFQGGDDHLSIGVDNRGRDIQDLVLVSPAWVAEHTLAMGTSRNCEPDPDAGTVHCGPVYAGQSFSAVLRGLPAHVGRFHYQLGLYDLEAGRLVPVAAADGNPLVVVFDEVVDPVSSQIPGWHPDPSPSSTIPG